MSGAETRGVKEAFERGLCLLIDASSRAVVNFPLQTPPSRPGASKHPRYFPKMAEDEPKSIRALFLTAERSRNNLNSYPDSNSPTYQENLTKAIATYEACLELSEQVSLFSPNESLDDVSSSDLQYVPIDALCPAISGTFSHPYQVHVHNLPPF
jgi:hypothetical protein